MPTGELRANGEIGTRIVLSLRARSPFKYLINICLTKELNSGESHSAKSIAISEPAQVSESLPRFVSMTGEIFRSKSLVKTLTVFLHLDDLR